jgi:hypothetical protein
MTLTEVESRYNSTHLENRVQKTRIRYQFRQNVK